MVVLLKKQASGGKWLISEAIVDTVRFYIHCSGDEVDEVLKVDLYQMVDKQDDKGESRKMRRNLEEKHMKMRKNMKSKMAKYLEPLLNVIDGNYRVILLLK